MQENLGILSYTDAMLIEFGIAMSLVRSTSCALALCTRRCDKTDNQSCRQPNDALNVVGSHDINESKAFDSESSCQFPTVVCDWDFMKHVLCYLLYLPLFISGPLMTFTTFCQQVLQSKPVFFQYFPFVYIGYSSTSVFSNTAIH